MDIKILIMCVAISDARVHTHTLSLSIYLSGSVHYFGLDANAVAGTVVAFVIAHGLAQDILGRTLDYTLKPASMLQWMLNIPNTTEPAKPKPKPRAPSTAKAPAKTPAKAPAKAPAKTPAKPKATPAPAPEPATRTSTRSRKKKD